MESEQLILHQYQASPFSAKVRRTLYFKGIDFQVQNYGISGAGKIRKLNPTGKAPVLQHGQQLIPDSTDIIRYLEQLSPDRPVIPADPGLRAAAHIIEDWADESLYFYDLTMRSWPNNLGLLADDLLQEDSGLMKRLFRPLIGKAIVKQASAQGVGRKDKSVVCREASAHFTAIDAMLGEADWLVGDTLSVADVAVASMCAVLERAEEAREMMNALAVLTAWRERVDALTLPANTPPEQRALV